MPRLVVVFVLAILMIQTVSSRAQTPDEAAKPEFDAERALALGADEYGMKSYVLVILKSGPTPLPAGDARNEMFKGHFANMKRLSDEKKLVLAGPLDGVDGWRGLFILAVPTIEEAKTHVATDPVIVNGEMIAEYHKYYGSAALMLINDLHQTIARKSPG